MATKTRDITPVVKGKRSPSTSKTRSLAHTNAINLIASNRKNTYLKSKVSSSTDKTQDKKPTPSTCPNIHHKQTLNHRTLMDRPPFNLGNTQVVKKNPTMSNDLNIVHNKSNVSFFDNRPSPPSSFDYAQGKKLASSSCVPPSIHNKQTLARRRLLFDNRPLQSSSLDHNNTHGKKLASSTSDSNVQNKQTQLARRRLSFDHRLPPSSFSDNSPQNKKLVQKSDHSIHRKQTPTRRRLSIDHKPPLLKNRTSPNPRERISKPPMPSSSKNFTSQKPLLPKTPHTSSKDVTGKQHGVGLNAKELNMNKTITKKQDSPTGSTNKELITTSNLTDIVASNNDPHEGEELEKDELQELVIEDNGELSDNVNIDEYLKAAESSSLYVVDNQEVIKMDVPKEEEQLVEETSIIKNHKELEEIKNLDLEEIEKQENENQQEKEKDEESETPLKELDDCQPKKEEEEEIDLKIDQEEKEESEGRNNKGKEENNNNKISTNTMAFAKAYPYLMHQKESVISSNDVIEETASKFREQRKNRVKALASAFETVISLQDSK